MLTWAWSGNERGPTLRSRLGEERSIHADSMKDATKTERWVDWINGRQRVSERWEPGFFFSFWMEKRSMGGFYEVLYIERPWIVLAIWEESARKDSEEGMNHHVFNCMISSPKRHARLLGNAKNSMEKIMHSIFFLLASLKMGSSETDLYRGWG